MGNCVRVSLNLSIEARAREHDVGAHHKPEGVIAHDRDLDKHAEDRQDHHNKRSNKPEVHCPDLPGYGETTKTLPTCSDIATPRTRRKAEGHRAARHSPWYALRSSALEWTGNGVFQVPTPAASNGALP